MTNSQLQLWQRLAAFEIDDGKPAFTFSARLARENGWDNAYAARVVDEYRRFLLLAMTAGHMVTPSEQVDQAWHLHLAYTHSYWERLCKDVLGRPLHHNPTAGGCDESRKFNDLYRQSLKSYREAFGEVPPSDIWPPPSTRFGSDLDARRVNTNDNWVVPKRAGRVGLSTCVVSLFITLGAMFGLKMPQWDPRGWIVLTVLTLICGYALAAVVRRRLRVPDDDGEYAIDQLDTYEIAYLAGGSRRAIDAAIASVVATETVRFHDDHKLSVQGPLPHHAHPLEETIVTHLEAGPRTLREVRVNLAQSMNRTAQKLETLGLTPTRSQSFWLRFLPTVVVIACVIPLALACTNQGLKMNAPKGVWSSLWFFAGLAGLVYFLQAPKRTLRGDRVLKELIFRNENLLALRHRADVPPDLLPLGVALFGAAILTGTPLAPLGKDLSASTSSSGGCSGCGSGDGGGGCGGGGCGGGCGGGGCGGG